MRIKKICAKEVFPVHHFEVDNLSDLVVIAGRNGVGKTRLISHIISSFQSAKRPTPNLHFEIESTNDEERTQWGKTSLNTSDANDLNKLRATLQKIEEEGIYLPVFFMWKVIGLFRIYLRSAFPLTCQTQTKRT